MFGFFAGLVALVAGAELLVRGAARLALSLRISPLVVGLTVVAFGTSAPELAVSVRSAWTGRVDIALGNVIGSNICNVLLILGAAAVVVPLVADRRVVRQEVPLMIGASLLLWLVSLDGGIGRGDGLLFVTLVIVWTGFLIRQGRRASTDPVDVEVPREGGFDRHWSVQLLLVVAGLLLLVAGAGWLVDAAVGFARQLGLSELVVGLTIVALGTSLPELATSVMAALRGQRDIAVGNVLGSCLFNILVVLGVAASVAPRALPVPPSLLAFDLPVMVAAAVACLPVFFTHGALSRWEGGLFLALYGAYLAYLVLAATAHDALRGYTLVMGGFVLPLVGVTLLVLAWRHWRTMRDR